MCFQVHNKVIFLFYHLAKLIRRSRTQCAFCFIVRWQHPHVTKQSLLLPAFKHLQAQQTHLGIHPLICCPHNTFLRMGSPLWSPEPLTLGHGGRGWVNLCHFKKCLSHAGFRLWKHFSTQWLSKVGCVWHDTLQWFKGPDLGRGYTVMREGKKKPHTPLGLGQVFTSSFVRKDHE